MGLSPRQGQADVLLCGVLGHLMEGEAIGGKGKYLIGICMYATPILQRTGPKRE